MTRQYSTIFYNTVECDKNKIQKIRKIQIHLLRNSNIIKVIKHSISYVISRRTNRNIKLTMQPHAFIRSTMNCHSKLSQHRYSIYLSLR